MVGSPFGMLFVEVGDGHVDGGGGFWYVCRLLFEMYACGCECGMCM